MTDIIRPNFGSKPQAVTPAAQKSLAIEAQNLEPYGTANGYIVALLRDDADPAGAALKIVVGPEDGNRVEPVALLAATPDAEVYAETVALAVLRTLEMIEQALEAPPPGA